MTKMAAMPIYGINTLNILVSRNQWVYFDETWYEASEIQAHYIYFVQMRTTYFTAMSNFATSAFIWENVSVMDTLEIIASCDLEFS